MTQWLSVLQVFLRRIWPSVIFTLQYGLPCVDINTHSRPVESIDTRTEATFNGSEKLSFHSANARAKHTASVLISCHNLSQAFPTAPSGEDCTYKNTRTKKNTQAAQSVCGRDTCSRAGGVSMRTADKSMSNHKSTWRRDKSSRQ